MALLLCFGGIAGMAWMMRTMYLSGLGLTLAILPVQLDARQASQLAGPAAPEAAHVAHAPEEFAGVWEYNAEESVNASTGRPEQNLRAGRATARTVVAAPSTVPPVSAGPVGGGGIASSGGESLRSYGSGTIGPTPMMIQESRNLRRDLMEIPEAFTIKVAPDAVTFIDDLDRERKYVTNGVKQKHQLGAAQFNASVQWESGHLAKQIEASEGFRMSETYFLSPDGRRLFVIVRLGRPRPGAPAVGVNRVYDRIQE